MAGKIFAYITHKTGRADDSARELATAAGKIYPDASTTAIVTGAGADLDAVCSEAAASYKEVWKFDNEALAYPNAEAILGLNILVGYTGQISLGHHAFFGLGAYVTAIAWESLKLGYFNPVAMILSGVIPAIAAMATTISASSGPVPRWSYEIILFTK